METEKTQTELLQEFCEAHTGIDYRSLDLDDAPCDWDNHWPIINADGCLTGDVFESEQPDGDEYANIDDIAMVLIDELSAAEQKRIRADREDNTWDGYAKLPSL